MSRYYSPSNSQVTRRIFKAHTDFIIDLDNLDTVGPTWQHESTWAHFFR